MKRLLAFADASPAITLRGIWIGMRRAATVIATTPATPPTMTARG